MLSPRGTRSDDILRRLPPPGRCRTLAELVPLSNNYSLPGKTGFISRRRSQVRLPSRTCQRRSSSSPSPSPCYPLSFASRRVFPPSFSHYDPQGSLLARDPIFLLLIVQVLLDARYTLFNHPSPPLLFQRSDEKFIFKVAKVRLSLIFKIQRFAF